MDTTQITFLVAGVSFVGTILGVVVGAWIGYRFKLKELEESYRFKIKEFRERRRIIMKEEEEEAVKALRKLLSDLHTQNMIRILVDDFDQVAKGLVHSIVSVFNRKPLEKKRDLFD